MSLLPLRLSECSSNKCLFPLYNYSLSGREKQKEPSLFHHFPTYTQPHSPSLFSKVICFKIFKRGLRNATGSTCRLHITLNWVRLTRQISYTFFPTFQHFFILLSYPYYFSILSKNIILGKRVTEESTF